MLVNIRGTQYKRIVYDGYAKRWCDNCGSKPKRLYVYVDKSFSTHLLNMQSPLVINNPYTFCNKRCFIKLLCSEQEF